MSRTTKLFTDWLRNGGDPPAELLANDDGGYAFVGWTEEEVAEFKRQLSAGSVRMAQYPGSDPT